MHVLFVHQNFPAQFRCLAPQLAACGWRVTFGTRNGAAPALPGVERVIYQMRSGATHSHHPCTRGFANGFGHAHGVYESMKSRPDLRPDLVVAHSGFGSSLFLPHLYDCPVVNFFEYFYRPAGQDLGYRPDAPVTELDVLRSRTRNASILLDLENCDRGWTPADYQRALFPPEFRPKIEVIPEGIDADLYRRRPHAPRRLPDGTAIDACTRVVTYVARGLERMRGFDVFMKAARLISARHANVLFVVVGGDKPAYGDDLALTAGMSLREHLLRSGDYDSSRFRFLGRVDESTLADVLSISDLHIYLTVPFVTSWSMLDAMSCSCVVLASDQACTREYITHERNGLLCDFFDVEGIAEQALKVLRNPRDYRVLGTAARLTIEEEYSVDVCLPRIKELFERVAGMGPRTPSLRAEVICRGGVEKRQGDTGTRGQGEGRARVEYPPFEGVVPFRVDGVPVKRWATAVDATRGGAIVPKIILFCWELGAGLGHLMQMKPLAEALAKAGHRVLMALRDLRGATRVLGGAGVSFLPAPYWSGGRVRFPRPVNFTQMLANLGWADDFELFGVACAWRNLIVGVRADLVIGDHSPTALLASRGLPVKRALIGSGFCCPPDEVPFPVFRPEMRERIAPGALCAFERTVLDCVNRRLRDWGAEPLAALAQLYAEVDENFLTTFPELDHYPGRAAEYWGPVLAEESAGAAPQWPDGTGKRVFAYLKPFPALPEVLTGLAESGRPTVAYVDGAAPALRRRFDGPSLRIESEPLDLRRATRECDVAVLNGGHGATAEMLLAGKPLLEIPLALEQRLTANAVKGLGAGEAAAATTATCVRASVDQLTDEVRYTTAATRFAGRYAAYDAAGQERAAVSRVAALLA